MAAELSGNAPSNSFSALLEQLDSLKSALLTQYQNDIKALHEIATRTPKATIGGHDPVSRARPDMMVPLDSKPSMPMHQSTPNMEAQVSYMPPSMSPSMPSPMIDEEAGKAPPSLDFGFVSEDWTVSDLDSEDEEPGELSPSVARYGTGLGSRVSKLQSSSSGQSFIHLKGARRMSSNTDYGQPEGKSRFHAKDAWREMKDELKDCCTEEILGGLNNMRETNSGLMSNHFLNASLRSMVVIRPNSAVGATWNLLRVLAVLYDVICVPIGTFLPVDIFVAPVELSLCIFWTLDVPVSCFMATFIEGVEVRDPIKLLTRYAKHWAAFDVVLLVLQWLEFAMDNTTFLSKHGLVKDVLVSMRLLRLLRLLRTKDRLLRSLMRFLPRGTHYHGIAPLMLFLPCAIHVLACAWYGLGGRPDGWLKEPELQAKSVFRQYLVAFHWVATVMHGSGSIFPSTAWEYIFASTLAVMTVLIFPVFIGHMVQIISTMNNLKRSQQHDYCRRYIRSRRISPDLVVRLERFFQTRNKTGVMQESAEETKQLYYCLPEGLQKALSEEVRGPILCVHQFFSGLTRIPGGSLCFSRVCHQATDVIYGTAKERIYAAGDQCDTMYFVETGNFIYNEQIQPPDNFVSMAEKDAVSGVGGDSHSSSRFAELAPESVTSSHGLTLATVVLTGGGRLCEPALWTKWRHRGSLTSVLEGTLITLDANSFVKVIGRQETAGHYALSYMKHFLFHVNHAPKKALSDLIRFDIALEDVCSIHGGHRPDEHLIFLSHFKKEAGTEAALIQESLERMVRTDITNPASEFFSPVFLDSEDLSDLRALAMHVRKSHNLVVLLTDQVLTRPWCLMELVIARRHGLNLCPVEISRDGIRFAYPSEEHYARIRSGAAFSPEDLLLLRSENIEMVEVEMAIRELFQHIALSFSPHKSWRLRQTELQDILKRCPLGLDKNRAD